MDNKIKKTIINKVTILLYNEFKNHKTIETWGSGDEKWKKVYLKNVGFSLINYAIYGRCLMAPERQFAYLENRALQYEEPKKKYKGVLAINPEDEQDLMDMESILKRQLHDNEIDARNTINNVIQTIISICSQ